MAADQISLDFTTDENVILLNPRFPKKDFDKLYFLAERTQQERDLQGHVWLATSGSTADSVSAIKLVALSKKSLQASAVAVNQHLQVSAQDVWTQVLPHFHVGGLGIEIRAELAGSRVVRALKDNKWDSFYFYETLCKEKCTLSALVPTQVYDLVARKLQAPKNLRAVVVGGGVLEPSLYEQARNLGWPLLPSYGMTETASQIATASLKSLQVNKYPEMSLLNHAEVCASVEGFLEVKALSLFTCYAQNLEIGPRHWDPKINSWFRTEDRGEVQGKILKVFGREADYVRIGGEGTNVAELRMRLEQAVLEFNPLWSRQVSLLDMPSERLGTELHMVTTLNPAEAEKLVNIYGEKVLPYEKIRKIHFVSEIPRTELGKIQWNILRRQLC